MKTVFFLIFSLVVSLYSFTQKNKIQYVPNINLDGSKSDWSEEYLIKNFKQNNSFNSNTANVYMGWNENYLFIFSEVKDNKLCLIKKKNEQFNYLNDAIEVFIDPLCDSKNTMDINDYQFIVSIDGKKTILKGDQRLTDSSYLAPKAPGISTLVFDVSLKTFKSASKYTFECAIPFAGIGIKPKKDVALKLDFCMDDADSTLDISNFDENEKIPQFYYSSWNGDKDFSFPYKWNKFYLSGEPSLAKKNYEKYYNELSFLFVFTLLFFIITIVFWFKRRKRVINEIQKESKSFKFEDGVYDSENSFIQKVKSIIIENVHEDISVEALAAKMNISVRTLQRIFKEEMNISPNTFITKIKMEVAVKLIRKGQLNMSEIAHSLGYNELSYFCKVFKKEVGISPKKFQK